MAKTYNLNKHPNAIINHPNQYANHPNRFHGTPPPPPATIGTLTPDVIAQLNQHGGIRPLPPGYTPANTPGYDDGSDDGGYGYGNFSPGDFGTDFNAPLMKSFMQHKYWMDNAINRGDDPARYGYGPMRTIAF